VGQRLPRCWRSVKRSPWYAFTVIGVLTAGIALTTVTFAVVDGVLFQPLPYSRPDELYLIRADTSTDPQESPSPVSWAEIATWRAALPDMTIGVAGAHARRVEQAAARDYYAVDVDDRFLEVLGVRPLIGEFSSSENQAGPRRPGDREYLHTISERHWRSLYASDLSIVGRPVAVGEREGVRTLTRIVSVLPSGFLFPTIANQEQPDVFTLFGQPDEVRYSSSRQARALRAIVRVPDLSHLPRVQARLLGATRQLALQARPATLPGRSVEQAPPFDQVTLVRLGDWVGRNERPAFLLAFSSAGILLLMTCLNVAALTVAKATERQGEMALRQALGASGAVIVKDQLAELGLLVTPACVLALFLSRPLLESTVDLLPPSLTLLKTPTVDTRVIAAAMASGLFSLLLVGLWPTRVLRGVDLTQTLGRASRSVWFRTYKAPWLLGVQTAAGFVMLMAAGLTGASLVATWTQDTGYDPGNLVMIEAYAAFYADTRDSSNQLVETRRLLSVVPGVTDVAVASIQPFFQSAVRRPYTNWIPLRGVNELRDVSSRMVSANYFQLMGLELVEGRWPDAAEWERDGPVALVSESTAALWWPQGSALGQALVMTSDRQRAATTPKVVVGVVRDARYSSLDLAPIRDVYVPSPIQPQTYGVFYLVRTGRSVHEVMPGLLQALSVNRLRTAQALSVTDALLKSVRHRALPAWLFGLLGATSLLVLGTGILGVIAMSVSHRTHEMGVRLALGSTEGRLVRLLLAEHLRPVVTGLIAGAIVAFWAVGLLEAQLFGVTARDVWVWVSVSLTILATAGVGALAPAMHAATNNPMQLFRSD
jgi:predicted permease